VSSFPNVLRPGRFGTLDLPNRVLMAPVGTGMGTREGRLSEREIDYFTARARGAAMLVPGMRIVTDEFEPVGPGVPRLDSDECVPPLAALAASLHAAGGLLCVQLTGGRGRIALAVDPALQPVSASDNTLLSNPSVACRQLETDEVKLLVRRFGEAAGRAASAGADAIEVHAHAGFLVDQFLSPQWNRRTDEYGGSTENRCRIVAQIIGAIRAAAPGLPVSVRLSVDHHFPGGRTLDESLRIAVELERAGADMLVVGEGAAEAQDYVMPPYYLGDAISVPASRAMKRVLRIPVATVGNLTPETAEAAIAAGDADFVGIGRGLIADPDWAAKLAEGRRGELRGCIRCNEMCTGHTMTGRPIGCSVNPQVGFERERAITPAATPKRVVVVGGGPAGLEAARVAGLRGHTVDLYEREDHLGGVLWPAATPDFKRELRGMVGWWERQLAGQPVTVHLGVSIGADSPELADAEAIIVATGSVPLVPAGIPGIGGANVLGVLEAHQSASVGHRVVVAGGGLSGADFALELAQEGHEVTIVEMLDGIARDLFRINRISLLRQLAQAGVTVLTEHRVVSVDEGGLAAVGPEGDEIHIAADTIVTAFGVRPAGQLAAALAGRAGVRAVGDCVSPAKVGDAVNAGFLAGLEA
jgi:2-enoate reductase